MPPGGGVHSIGYDWQASRTRIKDQLFGVSTGPFWSALYCNMAYVLHLVFVAVAQAAAGQSFTSILGPQPLWVWLTIMAAAVVGGWYTRPEVFAWRPILATLAIVALLHSAYVARDTIMEAARWAWAWVAALDATAIGEAIGNGVERFFTIVGAIVILIPLYLWSVWSRETSKRALITRFTLADIAGLITGMEPTVPLPRQLEEEYENLCRDARSGVLVVTNPEEPDKQQLTVSRDDLREYLRERDEDVPRFLTERYDWHTTAYQD